MVLVDYGTGNLRSIQNMFARIGVASHISSDPEIIASATKLILPGVGHFDFGMTQLNRSGLRRVLEKQVFERKTPILGICLGAQLLTRRSDEGNEPGLAWIDAETVRFDRSRLQANTRIPHMGWTDTTFASTEPLFHGLESPSRFYYVHSYHLNCKQPEDEMCFANYGYRFVSGIRHENVMGVQFHPEKSHHFGMQVLKNFAFMEVV